MLTSTVIDELSERRAHKRHPVTFAVRCRRLGPRRAGATQVVDVVDVSLGGMKITAPPWVDVGNVLEVELDGVGLRALVVALSGHGLAPGPASTTDERSAGYAHLAFGSLSDDAFRVVLEVLESRCLGV